MIVLGLGSNCGDRLQYLRNAIQKLKSPLISPRVEVLAISPIYESEALLPESAPESWNQPFLNLNLLCRSDLSPLDLLHHIKSLEASIGRKQRGRWAPREIDIDILVMGNEVFESENLKIPHPRLMDRPFAMLPLADLYPQWTFPSSGSSVSQPISELVSPWRRKPQDQVPFKTHRSQLYLNELVGIINITPDSFSDGGHCLDPEVAIARGHELVAQGARVLDIGAESTRPGAQIISPAEEWKRLEPVLSGLLAASQKWTTPVSLSLDTRHAETVQCALKLGVHWINDVTGFGDLEMCKQVANSDVSLVIMHSLTVPPTRNAVLSTNSPPIDLILEFGERRIEELRKLGISRERIIFDPGIGFGKTIEQTWEILRTLGKLQELGVRILVGHSRKSFLSSLTDQQFSERDIETITLSLELTAQGVDFLRIHNIELHMRALKTWSQVNGIIQCSPRAPFQVN